MNKISLLGSLLFCADLYADKCTMLIVVKTKIGQNLLNSGLSYYYFSTSLSLKIVESLVGTEREQS